MKQKNVVQLLQIGGVIVMNKFKVVEIFQSISGESANSGLTAIFIRLYGCNLRCKYSESGCDTPYGYEGGIYEELTYVDIINRIHDEISDAKYVILTGGEPLIQPQVETLIGALIYEGYEVEVETNGTINICDMTEKVNAFLKQRNSLVTSQDLRYTVDYKCNCSGMTSNMLPRDQFISMISPEGIGELSTSVYNIPVNLKFVVKTEADLFQAENFLDSLLNSVIDVPFEDAQDYKNMFRSVFISPVFGANIPELVSYINNSKILSLCRFQLQIHKYIWDPEKRGV